MKILGEEEHRRSCNEDSRGNVNYTNNNNNQGNNRWNNRSNSNTQQNNRGDNRTTQPNQLI